MLTNVYKYNEINRLAFHIMSKIVSEYDQEIPQSQTADFKSPC